MAAEPAARAAAIAAILNSTERLDKTNTFLGPISSPPAIPGIRKGIRILAIILLLPITDVCLGAGDRNTRAVGFVRDSPVAVRVYPDHLGIEDLVQVDKGIYEPPVAGNIVAATCIVTRQPGLRARVRDVVGSEGNAS